MRHTHRLISLMLLGIVLAFTAGCGQSGLAPGVTREYYIVAKEQSWNYAPNGGVGFQNFTSTQVVRNYGTFAAMVPYTSSTATSTRIGTTYQKALFVQYSGHHVTNGVVFDKVKQIPTQWQHLGALGPVIRAQVGDTIIVHLWNNTSHSLNITPNGLYASPADSTGKPLQNYTTASTVTNTPVLPGNKQDYSWMVPDRAGPITITTNTGVPRVISTQTGNEAASVVWTYGSKVDPQRDEDAGLIGPIIIYSRGGFVSTTNVVAGISTEVVTMYKVYNENNSYLLPQNLASAGVPSSFDSALLGQGFINSNLKYTINGYMYGNFPMPVLTQNSQNNLKTRWYVIAANGADAYTPSWEGNNVLLRSQTLYASSYASSVTLTPGASVVADMVPDHAGVWRMSSALGSQYANGMYLFYQVNSTK